VVVLSAVAKEGRKGGTQRGLIADGRKIAVIVGYNSRSNDNSVVRKLSV